MKNGDFPSFFVCLPEGYPRSIPVPKKNGGLMG